MTCLDLELLTMLIYIYDFCFFLLQNLKMQKHCWYQKSRCCWNIGLKLFVICLTFNIKLKAFVLEKTDKWNMFAKPAGEQIVLETLVSLLLLLFLLSCFLHFLQNLHRIEYYSIHFMFNGSLLDALITCDINQFVWPDALKEVLWRLDSWNFWPDWVGYIWKKCNQFYIITNFFYR